MKSAENPELPPYILSWEGRFKQNMMIWNFPPDRSYKILMLWLLFLGRCCLFLSIHIVQEGFPCSQSPFRRPKVSTRYFLNLSRSRSQLNIWMVRCEDIITLGCSPSDPPEGLRFYLGIPINLHLPLFLLEHPTS